MYYGVLVLCAVMFGTQFFFTNMFKEAYGNDFKAMCVSSVGSAIVGIILLSLINGFSFGYTHFSLIMAVIVSVNSKLFTFCSLKALGKINLSLYSIFSMLGGMALPFVAGIFFFDEQPTLGKIICFVFIALAILVTIEKGDKSKGAVYYIGIFIFNGMSGVLSKIYMAMPFEKVSASEYSILCCIVNLVMSLILLLFVRKVKRRINLKAVISIIGYGTLNRLANFLLLICLAYLPASAQYPFITGGTMVVSTVISYITRQKPGKKELLSVVLSFIGILALVLIV